MNPFRRRNQRALLLLLLAEGSSRLVLGARKEHGLGACVRVMVDDAEEQRVSRDALHLLGRPVRSERRHPQVFLQRSDLGLELFDFLYMVSINTSTRGTPKDKIFEKVINPYLTEVLKYPQSIKMSEGMLLICDVEGPKKTGSVETRLETMEQQVFKCQGMVERGLNANHMMITEFTNNHKMDAIDIGKHLSRLYDRVDQLQGQIYDM
ncbi:40S ribosomal protein S5-1 [Hordeum vulgare]|nr:40S ribosomal protein S5-1 [Hordeum vulgare]